MTRKIIPGVYQLEIPIPNNPLGFTNDYLVQGGDVPLFKSRSEGFVLIDTGWNGETALNALGRELSEIGATYRDIKEVVVTHGHADHYGMAERVRQASGAKVALHHLDAEMVNSRHQLDEESARRMEEWFQANGAPANEFKVPQTSFGGNRPSQPPPQPDILLNGNEVISHGSLSLKVIWTPGHSPGHICLYEQERGLLFAGDHVLPVITPNISLPPNSEANPLGDFLKSLNALKNLRVNYVLPAHEGIFSDLSKRIDEILQHHETRNDEISRAIGEKPTTAFQASHAITWMPELGGVRFENLSSWDQRAAVSETLAHLRAMVVDGRATVNRENGHFLYERAK